jgi:cytoskeletal protein CcmA (bactofilin family)
MRHVAPRSKLTRAGLLVAALALAAGARAADPPAPPDADAPPAPPVPPEVSVQGFTVRSGETHKGNVVKVAPSVVIEGTLDGDLYAIAQSVRISGVVTGDVFASGSEVEVTGKVEKSFRAAAANVVVDGDVNGNVLVTGGNFSLGGKSKVHGSVSAYTGQFTQRGTVSGSLTFTGGTAVLGGKVEDDAALTADAIEIEQGARVDGDIEYSTRKPMDAKLKAIAGGDVSYNEAPIREKRRKDREERSLTPTKFGVGKWIAFFTASFLFGCALLAVFSAHEPKVTAAIGADALRCAGIGFVSILVTIAVILSAILLITIPFVLIYLLGYIVAAYLAKIPVAIWLGRFLLEKAKRPAGAYMALFVGLVAIYLVFMIPVLGILAQCLAALLGLGAITMTYLAHRQARRAVPVGGETISL